MSGAVGLWVRADWRRRYKSLVALALLAGLGVAVVATAIAGSRRAATSVERLREATSAYDQGIATDAPGSSPAGEDGYDDATVERIRRLPQIEASGLMTIYVASVPDADWELGINVPQDDVVGNRIQRDRVVRGRVPDPDSAHEIALNEAAAEAAQVDVRSAITLATLSPDQHARMMAGDPHAFDDGLLGPELTLRVVGVFRDTSDIAGESAPAAFGTPAFDAMYRGRVAHSMQGLMVQRAPGYTALDLEDAVDAVTSGFQLGIFDAAVEEQPLRSTTDVIAAALAVFALITCLVAMLAVNQAVVRHVNGADTGHPALIAIGLTRRQRVLAGVLTTVPAAAAAAVLAVAVSYAASGLMPVGLARRVEPAPGLRFDALVAGLAALAAAATILLAALIAARSATRRAPSTSGAGGRASYVTSVLATAGVRPVPATGIRMAFDRRTPALPVRSTIVGVASALAVLAGAVTFAASLDRLQSSPQRWGYGWDLMLEVGETETEQLGAALTARTDVDDAAELRASYTLFERDGRVDGSRAYGLTPTDGEVGYALLSGTQPVGPDEAVIGPGTARSAGVSVGDMITVAVCPCSGDPETTELTEVRVVGTALFPSDDDGNFNDALGFSDVGFDRHVGWSESTRIAIAVAPGYAVDAVADDLDRVYPGTMSSYSHPEAPADVESLGGLRAFPRVLSLVAVVLGLATLANMLLATRQRRRRELATLRGLGFTSRATRGCMVWQSVAITTFAAVIGVTLGIAGGAGVWRATTDGIGIATDASRPIALLLWCSLAAIVAAVVLGSIAGARLSNVRVADALRHE